MSITNATKRVAAYGRNLPARWQTAALFAIAIAYADGFWLTALQGAIGAIERVQSPVIHWLRDATLMLPLVFVAVVGALLLARRWMGRTRSKLAGFVLVVLLVAVLTGVVGLAKALASSAYDYSFQVKHLWILHSFGNNTQLDTVGLAGFGAAAPASYYLYCSLRGVSAQSAIAQLEYITLMLHIRAMYLAAVLLLATNLIVVTALLAWLHDRLWSTRVTTCAQYDETINHGAAEGVLG
jgi:hypothetical protein